MFFQEHAIGIRLHAGRESHRVESLRVALVLLQALCSQHARLRGRILKPLDAAGIGSAGDASEKALVIQEIIAGEHPLAVKLLEQIAGRDGDLAEGLRRVFLRPLLKNRARFGEFLFVEKVVAIFQFRNRTESGSFQFFDGLAAAGRRGKKDRAKSDTRE